VSKAQVRPKAGSQYTFNAAAEDAVGRARTSQKSEGQRLLERKNVPSAEVETADLEITLGIGTNRDKGGKDVGLSVGRRYSRDAN